MLILARKENEEILLGNDIKVVVVSISKSTVKLGIEAPRNTMILRSELANDIKNENILHAPKKTTRSRYPRACEKNREMKSFAKINVFLKVVGTRGNYHEILSRFVLCEQLFDEIYFERSNSFAIECDNKEIKDNIIQKAIDELKKAGFSNELDEFFSSHKIIINKQIPIGAGLGGGSSNAATFLLMVNDELNLNIKRENLMQIASKIGADVAFFVSGYKAANVSGIGEIIEEFDDEVPNLNIFTPNVFCSTPMVYQEFRSNFLQYIDVNAAKKMQNLKSKELLEIYKNEELNDLFAPCFKLYPQMNEFRDKFLSGSGSSVFSVK